MPFMPDAILRQLAKEALDVQNACNLSGVVHSFSRAMTKLSEAGFDTDAKNKHPLAVLYSNKIASLTGSESVLQFSKAYNWASDMAQGVEAPPCPDCQEAARQEPTKFRDGARYCSRHTVG